ncbi:MAG: hydroxymethylbilane synthase [Planctomycetota bacterium]|jgi:hydroxymethylbilane synthase|nr:hydroxymethylbilane synthase [Planctomycetota bacterium]MDP6839211.1 hydroxymethylbilane synthase [Planctomycetota bacterium]
MNDSKQTSRSSHSKSLRKPLVASRGSDLAREQTRRVRAALDLESELRIVRTAGDRQQHIPLSEQTGAGFFTKDIEEQLLAGEVDMAVHSLKDLPVQLAPGLVFGAHLERDVPSDILLVRPEALDESRPLPVRRGGRVGASSARRQALLGLHAPDLVPADIRGNVPTRVDKAKRGDFDAILLSRAGVERLQLDTAPLLVFELDPRSWPGAPGQATIAVETRTEEADLLTALDAINHRETEVLTGAERCLLLAYGGGCHAPFGAYARRTSSQVEVFVAAAPLHVEGEDPRAKPMHLRCFPGADLSAAVAAAQAWIVAGCGALGDAQMNTGKEQAWPLWQASPAWS